MNASFLSSLHGQLTVHYLVVTLAATVLGLAVASGVARSTALTDLAERHEVVAATLAPVAADLMSLDAPAAAFTAFLERPILAEDVDGTTITRSLPRPPSGSVTIVDLDGTHWFQSAGLASSTGLTLPAIEEAVRRGSTVHRFALLRVDTIVPLTVDTRPDGPPVGALALTSTIHQEAISWARRAAITLAWATPTIALLSIGFGLIASRGWTRRVRAIQDAAASWSSGDLRRLVRDGEADELGVLARRLDRMAERLDHQRTVHRRQAIERERRRIARDLHDSVKQQLFASRLRLAGACDAPLEALREHAQAVERWLRKAQVDLDGVVRALHGPSGDGRELHGAVMNVINRWRELGPAVHASVAIDEAPSIEVAVAVERIVEEALANVVRHAAATRVGVTVSVGGDAAVVEVVDDGVGCDLDRVGRKGIGLTAMRERAEELGGRLEIGPASLDVDGSAAPSEPAGARLGARPGTRLRVTLPLAPAATFPVPVPSRSPSVHGTA